MCYNVRVELTKQEIAQAFDLTNADLWDGPRSHITLGQYLPAIVQTDQGRQLDLMYWGYTPSWWTKDDKGGTKPGNARADTVATTPLFRGSFRHMRCIVPVSAFMEWQGEKGSKELIPFTVKGTKVIALPAVWSDWVMPDGTERNSLAVITCDPNSDMTAYHDRMPVILDPEDVEKWLSPEAKRDDLLSLLMPLADGEITAHPELAFKPTRGKAA